MDKIKMDNRDANPSCDLLQCDVLNEPQLFEAFEKYRDRLKHMVSLRLDRHVRGRIDASDVLQEARTEAWKRLPEYLRNPTMPVFVWLRFLTHQELLKQHQHHLKVQRRDARREIGHDAGRSLESPSDVPVAHFPGRLTSPSQAAMRVEQQVQVQAALADLDPTEREILELRHIKGLSNRKAAAVLGLSASAASKRYTRALKRFKTRYER